jgi:hypothetical protein
MLDAFCGGKGLAWRGRLLFAKPAKFMLDTGGSIEYLFRFS